MTWKRTALRLTYAGVASLLWAAALTGAAHAQGGLWRASGWRCSNAVSYATSTNGSATYVTSSPSVSANMAATGGTAAAAADYSAYWTWTGDPANGMPTGQISDSGRMAGSVGTDGSPPSPYYQSTVQALSNYSQTGPPDYSQDINEATLFQSYEYGITIHLAVTVRNYGIASAYMSATVTGVLTL